MTNMITDKVNIAKINGNTKLNNTKQEYNISTFPIFSTFKSRNSKNSRDFQIPYRIKRHDYESSSNGYSKSYGNGKAWGNRV